MNETLEYLETFARFPFALRKFLQHPLTFDKAKQIVHERLEQREENFLRIVETSVYAHPRSPYMSLLKMAGCEMGDLRALVNHQGLENALRQLRAAGVYITFEEFKGRKPIIRNGLNLPVTPRDFDNPFARADFSSASSGSTGLALTVGVDLDHLAALSINELITCKAWNVLDTPTIIWRGILPDATLKILFQTALFRKYAYRWFSHIGLRDSKQWLKYGLATWYIVTWMKAMGISVPFPEYVPIDRADRVLKAIVSLRNRHQHVLVRTSVSRGVRICNEAERAGISLDGVIIRGVGEPATPAKISAIERVQARFLNNYSLTEAGSLGNGCAHANTPGDVHLFTDGFALIPWSHRVDGFETIVPAFNLTTLLPTAPKILLNLQMDDYGTMEQYPCDCLLGKIGYTTHLKDIRSYSKLVGEGVTLIGNELITIIEQVLPAQFGGTLFDYQFVEQEDDHGLTRLFLIVHPRLGIIDEHAIVQVVLNALRDSSPMADATRTVWQQTQTIQIKRQEPKWTERGKFMPLQIQLK
jgi:hypothetical protein